MVNGQSLKNIKKFEDIKFTQGVSNKKMYYASIIDNRKEIFSIIFGESALYGANHGMREGSNTPKEKDNGYELLDKLNDSMSDYSFPYVVSRKQLMRRIKTAQKYIFDWEACEECNTMGYILHKKERK